MNNFAHILELISIIVGALGVIIPSVITIISALKSRKRDEESKKRDKELDIKTGAMHDEDTRHYEELKARQELIAEATLDLMRDSIQKLYYKRQEGKWLYQYERQSLDKMYAGYHAGGGNTFVDDIYKEMRTWQVRSF